MRADRKHQARVVVPAMGYPQRRILILRQTATDAWLSRSVTAQTASSPFAKPRASTAAPDSLASLLPQLSGWKCQPISTSPSPSGSGFSSTAPAGTPDERSTAAQAPNRGSAAKLRRPPLDARYRLVKLHHRTRRTPQPPDLATSPVPCDTAHWFRRARFASGRERRCPDRRPRGGSSAAGNPLPSANAPTGLRASCTRRVARFGLSLAAA
jgi:hypothetical protein